MERINFVEIFRPNLDIKNEFKIILTFTTDQFSKAVDFCETLYDRMFDKKPKFKFERKNGITTLFLEKDLRGK